MVDVADAADWASRFGGCLCSDWEKAEDERTPPDAAWKSSMASADGFAKRMPQWASNFLSEAARTGVHVFVEESCALQFTEDGGHVAGAMHILHQVGPVGDHPINGVPAISIGSFQRPETGR